MLTVKQQLTVLYNTITRHEQVCLMRLRFRPDDVRNIRRNLASLNILAHDVINLLYYEQ